MIKIKVTLNYRGSMSATRKALGQAKRKSLRVVGLYWRRRTLPMHFTQRAASRYGYQARSTAYRRRKIHHYGHNRPMVFSGVMREQITGRAEVRATANNVRVKLSANALNFSSRSKTTLYPNFREELTAITAEELDRAARQLDEGVGRELNAVQTPETKSFG